MPPLVFTFLLICDDFGFNLSIQISFSIDYVADWRRDDVCAAAGAPLLKRFIIYSLQQLAWQVWASQLDNKEDYRIDCCQRCFDSSDCDVYNFWWDLFLLNSENGFRIDFRIAQKLVYSVAPRPLHCNALLSPTTVFNFSSEHLQNRNEHQTDMFEYDNNLFEKLPDRLWQSWMKCW